MAKTKRPKVRALAPDAPLSRQPKIAPRASRDDGKLVIRFGNLDLGSPWCLTKITPGEHLALLQKVRDFESMTVDEVFSTNGKVGKDYEIAELPTRQARERIVELQHDDETKISRLQLGGKPRLYGFRRDNQFYALWWDPEHEIWPSPKKHT